ncbi:MFS transporter [Streptomyces albiaxialis]|uniref:MFS transporter n=1 Tax=Streptomyces albiaxialis TaxID=329523 RepID=A0ABN2W6E8_9ACTN
MTDPEGHPRRRAILAALCAALLVIVLDNTVLNVALPDLAEDFDASTGTLQAVIDAYAVVFAGLLIAAGAASDRYGRRRALLTGLAVLGLASAAAALATSAWWLIAMRAAMGAGAALVMPATLAILVRVFPARERPRAFAVWAAVAAVAMAAGPVLGGALVAAWSWAGVFLLNVPVVLAAALAVARLVPESRDPLVRPVDPAGAALVTAGMVALTGAVIVAGHGGTGHGGTGPGGTGAGGTVVPAAGLLVAALALAAFVRRQRRAPAPVVEFALYRDRRFAGGSAAAALLTLGTGSALFVLAQYLQLVRGLSALEAGAALVPLALGTVLGSALGGRAPARLGARATIVLGFTATAAGFLLLAALTPTSPYALVAGGLLLQGWGTGFSSPATTATVLGAVPSERAGMGSALNDTHQQLGIALGVALLGSLLAAVYRAALPASVPAGARGSLAATLRAADGGGFAGAAKDAFVTAQSVTMLTAAGCALTGALVAGAVLRDPLSTRTQDPGAPAP